ncbi:hypothetical protein BG005_004447 [Podila minutissima]|nr:hypothetical protein BG005_004447 [Podila minutissima]
MKAIQPAAIILAIAVMAAASPIALKGKRATENIVVVPLKRNAMASMLNPNKPFQRRQDTSSSPLTNHETLFTAEVAIGTPPQTFQLIVDTGSSDTWVDSTECETTSCDQRSKFHPDDSATLNNTNKDFSVEYGDGSKVTNTLVRDTVTINDITVSEQDFGLAKVLFTDVKDTPGAGLLGLAFQSISKTESRTFTDTAYDQGVITDDSFALYLPPSGDGEMTLGGYNPSRLKGELRNVPLAAQDYWKFNLEGFTVDNEDAEIEPHQAIMDSGASLIILGDIAVKQLYSKIPGAKHFDGPFWSVPCTANNTIAFKMGGFEFPIPINGTLLGLTEAGSSDCVGGIQGGATEEFILGLQFMKFHYVVFDKSPPQLGIALINI